MGGNVLHSNLTLASSTAQRNLERGLIPLLSLSVGFLLKLATFSK